MDILPVRQVHLDFHTSEKIDGVGSMFDKAQFQKCLKKGHVNSITVFSKCHHGMSYHPTKVGVMHPGLHGFNLLRAQLDACREIGVHAPVYISAGFDQQYAVKHPEDRYIDKPEATFAPPHFYAGYTLLCFNSPYLDLLVKETEEVVRDYDPEGIFLDIVAPRVCFCRHCRRVIEEKGLDQSNVQNFVDLADETYKKYYTAVNNAARAIKPDIRIFHNGGNIACGRRDFAHANTHLELESLPTGGWGYDHFPKSAKYVQLLGMEFLGMTGKFHQSWGEFGGFKHPNALKYEVALSMAHGAKCSVGDQMHPYGFLDEATYALVGTAYSEAEKIEQYCYDVKPVSDIAVLSVEAFADGKERLNAPDVGACRMLNECKYLYNIIDRETDFSAFKLLVLPDNVRVDSELEKRLKDFLFHGGKLLCTGTSGLKKDADDFAFDFGVKYVSPSQYNPTYLRPEFSPYGLPSSSFVIYAPKQDVELTDKSAQILCHSREPFFNRTPEHFCSHKHAPFTMADKDACGVVGKDGAYIGWSLFTEYAKVGCLIARETVKNAIEALIGSTKTIETSLPSLGLVTLMQQVEKSRYVLHLLYATPAKRGENIEVIEDLADVYDTTVSVKVPTKVKRLYKAPQNEDIAFTQDENGVHFTVDRFNCHQTVVLDV